MPNGQFSGGGGVLFYIALLCVYCLYIVYGSYRIEVI